MRLMNVIALLYNGKMRGEEQRKKEKRNKSEKKPVAQTQMFLRRNRRIIVGQ